METIKSWCTEKDAAARTLVTGTKTYLGRVVDQMEVNATSAAARKICVILAFIPLPAVSCLLRALFSLL